VQRTSLWRLVGLNTAGQQGEARGISWMFSIFHKDGPCTWVEKGRVFVWRVWVLEWEKCSTDAWFMNLLAAKI
jgi:hypothetical protein